MTWHKYAGVNEAWRSQTTRKGAAEYRQKENIRHLKELDGNVRSLTLVAWSSIQVMSRPSRRRRWWLHRECLTKEEGRAQAGWRSRTIFDPSPAICPRYSGLPSLQWLAPLRRKLEPGSHRAESQKIEKRSRQFRVTVTPHEGCDFDRRASVRFLSTSSPRLARRSACLSPFAARPALTNHLLSAYYLYSYSSRVLLARPS